MTLGRTVQSFHTSYFRGTDVKDQDNLAPWKRAFLIWLVLMIGTFSMIGALAVSQYTARNRFLERHLTPPPKYTCAQRDKEAGECL